MERSAVFKSFGDLKPLRFRFCDLGISAPATSGKEVSPNPEAKRQTLMFLLMLRQDQQKRKWRFSVRRPPGSLAREGDINQKSAKTCPKEKERVNSGPPRPTPQNLLNLAVLSVFLGKKRPKPWKFVICSSLGNCNDNGVSIFGIWGWGPVGERTWQLRWQKRRSGNIAQPLWSKARRILTCLLLLWSYDTILSVRGSISNSPKRYTVRQCQLSRCQ